MFLFYHKAHEHGLLWTIVEERITLRIMSTEQSILEELSFLGQPLGVISTVNVEGRPESSSIYYVYDEALNFYFITRAESRKYINIKNNPYVSFVVTKEHPPHTLQVEGVASHVTDPHEEDEHFTRLIALASERLSMPPVSQISGGEMLFMKIETMWARIGNFEVMKEGNKFVEVKL